MDRLGKILEWCKSDRVRPPAYSEKTRASLKRCNKRHALKHPDRFEARKARFKIPVQPCEVCGSEDNIHRHHHNYSKPDDVIFLCKAHHAEMHKWDSN